MNIVFFLHDSRISGSIKSLVDLLVQLKNKGVNCFVFMPFEGPLCNTLIELNIPYKVIRYHGWICGQIPTFFKNPFEYLKWKKNTISKLIKNVIILPEMLKLCKKHKVNICYSNTSVVYIGYVISKLLNVSHLWHIREFIDPLYSINLEWGNYYYNVLLKGSDAKIFISKALQNNILKDRIYNNAYMVYNGVGIKADFDRYKDCKNKTDIFYFLIMGTLQEGKGQADAISVFSKIAGEYPNAKLMVVGKGDQTTLKKLSKQLKVVDKVDFIGHAHNPHEYYCKADVLLMCSKKEAFGRVTAEAMMHSLPVIGYNDAGTMELIRHGQNGFLYNTLEEMEYYCKLLVENGELRKNMGDNAWNFAKENFNSEDYGNNIYNILTKLITK